MEKTIEKKTQSSELSGKFAQDAFASVCTCALKLKGSHPENNRGDRIKSRGQDAWVASHRLSFEIPVFIRSQLFVSFVAISNMP